MSELTMEELLPDNPANGPANQPEDADAAAADRALKSVIEAIIYVAVEPVTVDQIIKAIEVGPSDLGHLLGGHALERAQLHDARIARHGGRLKHLDGLCLECIEDVLGPVL